MSQQPTSPDDDTQELKPDQKVTNPLELLDLVAKPSFSVDLAEVNHSNFSQVISQLEVKQSKYLKSLHEVIVSNGGFLKLSTSVLNRFAELANESLQELMTEGDRIHSYLKNRTEENRAEA